MTGEHIDLAMPTAAPGRTLLTRAEIALGYAIEVPVVFLCALEILILFAGVVSRYVFHAPLTWSDELASILFLWLAMLGAVVAFRRGEHMRMSVLVARAPPRLGVFFEAFAAAVAIAFLALILQPAIEHAADEAIVLTPALELPSVWRAAAVPVGCALMLLVAVLRLARLGGIVELALALVLIAAIGGALWLAKPALMAIGNYRLLVFFVLLVGAGVLAGAPIAFVFAIATFAFLAITTRTPLTIVVSRIDEGMSHIILLSVPLFVFLGLLIEATGMAKAMVDFLASLLGHVRGGLSYVLLGAMYLVSGISGSKAADMAAVAPVLFPEMKNRGARPGDLVALLSSSGAMSETIPPSLAMLVLGSVAPISIGTLFIAGLLPAAVIALLLMTLNYALSRHRNSVIVPRASAKEMLRATAGAMLPLVMPVIMVIGIRFGFATPTEVSAVAVLYGLILAFVIYRAVDTKALYTIAVESCLLAGMVLFIIAAAFSFAWTLTAANLPGRLAAILHAAGDNATVFLIGSILLLIVVGSLLEGLPALIILSPLLMPIASQYGIDVIHYSMIMILAMGVGIFIPPIGIGFYISCSVSESRLEATSAAMVPYFIVLLLGVLVVAFVPSITLAVPHLLRTH